MSLKMAGFGIHFPTSWKLTWKDFVIIFNVGFRGRIFPAIQMTKNKHLWPLQAED